MAGEARELFKPFIADGDMAAFANATVRLPWSD